MGGLSPPFFLFTEIFLRWPDQLSVKNLDRPIRYWNLEDVALLSVPDHILLHKLSLPFLLIRQ